MRLHRAMLARGAVSDMLVWDRRGDDARTSVVGRRGWWAHTRRFAGRAWYRYASRRKYLFRDQRTSLAKWTGLVGQATAAGPNLIVVHYVSDFISFADIAELQAATGARVVWNLLDMAHLTGGCHYAWDCPGYEVSCGHCPALILSSGHDASQRTMVEKRRSLAAMDYVVVAPSYGVEMQARQSSLFRDADIRRILIGIDPAEIPDVDRADARLVLGLPLDGTILFFGAQTFDDRRKGMGLLIEALAEVRGRLGDGQPVPRLVVAGGGHGSESLDALDFPTVRLGYIDAPKLALAYAAADFFLCPSVEDSGPMMVNEAIMAGTPVIAFPVGVVPDLVIDGQTGLIARQPTAPALAAAILQGLSWTGQQRAAARRSCRATAIERCSLDVQVEQMLSLASQVAVAAAGQGG